LKSDIFASKICNFMDIVKLKEEALKRRPQWLSFYRKHKKVLMKSDRQIHALHDLHTQQTNCLECGNCCRTLGPRLLPADVEQLAKTLRMKTAAFISQYIRTDEDGDFVFQSMPCPFLGADNYCAVYESRPKACREYPHTDRRNFYQIFSLSVKNAETCPIVYGVLTDLTEG
jgi:uncharacterized protein